MTAYPAGEARFMRPLSALMALHCMGILLRTRDAVFLGAHISACAHVNIVVRVPETIQNHAICKLQIQAVSVNSVYFSLGTVESGECRNRDTCKGFARCIG